MKNILMSIQPQWCELIATGKKTIETRKTKPKMPAPFKCYIYCTKGGYSIYGNDKYYVTDHLEVLNNDSGKGFEETSALHKWNGKIIGEFICEKVKPIFPFDCVYDEDLLSSVCLSSKGLLKYSNLKRIYGWHIANVVMYDEAKELKNFNRSDKKLKKAPKDWCYVDDF